MYGFEWKCNQSVFVCTENAWKLNQTTCLELIKKELIYLVYKNSNSICMFPACKF